MVCKLFFFFSRLRNIWRNVSWSITEINWVLSALRVFRCVMWVCLSEWDGHAWLEVMGFLGNVQGFVGRMYERLNLHLWDLEDDVASRVWREWQEFKKLNNPGGALVSKIRKKIHWPWLVILWRYGIPFSHILINDYWKPSKSFFTFLYLIFYLFYYLIFYFLHCLVSILVCYLYVLCYVILVIV